ncbi:unnamed protein product [Closterium sp. NIES-65]|nr:unnamed protein product [Closterium sp. NIES-65]
MALDDVARPLGAERAGDQTVWRDADAALAAACAELQSGELLHGESFSLFEAMAALQVHPTAPPPPFAHAPLLEVVRRCTDSRA